jgi:hypothetical protein
MFVLANPPKYDYLKVVISENLSIISTDGYHFFVSDDDEIVSVMYIYKCTDIIIGNNVFFSRNHSYGIVNQNNKFFLLRRIKNDQFKAVGQIISKETKPF